MGFLNIYIYIYIFYILPFEKESCGSVMKVVTVTARHRIDFCHIFVFWDVDDVFQ